MSLRRWVKTVFKRRFALNQIEVEELEKFKGKKAIVAEKIGPNTQGKVESRGSYWEGEAHETIPEGATVKIIDQQNIAPIVKSL